MASQNVLQLTQQAGSADTSSVLYAVRGGNTDTGLPLSVLFNAAHLTAPVVTGGAYTGGSFSGIAITSSTIAGSTIAGGSADNISIGGLTPGAGAFTTLAASGTVSGAGFTTLLSPYALKSGNLSQFAATTSAQLASIISDESGSGSLVFGTTPTLNQPNIVGTTTNNNAAAGSVGEFASNSTSAVSLTSTVSANATSVSLTAGDWDVTGIVTYIPAAGTTGSGYNHGISTVSATIQANQNVAQNFTMTTGVGQQIAAPLTRISIASTTTIFLVANFTFSGGTATCNGFIRARRVR